MEYIQPDSIADYLIAECRERGENLTNLKLQKLLYYADAWSLALSDEPLFAEDFKAWVHGPVLLSQYHRFKDNKWRPIVVDIDRPKIDENLAVFLDEIVDVFGCESAVALELMTHRELPWLEARGDLAPSEPSTASISKETTRLFYRSMNDG
ncbi:Panacea domain-containing protein [Croceicoccus naphthovorans]|uniref:Uncharacterized protein n=1 Tax=Croceicoccus naphthovorans TaxID=1348774 RepID=A0A0G3XD08_9SPHN|nr:type II toxin-antitoxin system antitoxin SocA domain-containing protein [Croceicoccus naphthovorans]AKM09022.1 hypothetical protein AB433_02015 [Croceicoccus naphthovorans]MBB3991488.1 putative phage-associated protein [Croceicoccus naphthovorans]